MNLYSIKNKFISFFLTSFSMSIVLAGCGGVPPDTWGTPNPDYLELVDVSSCWYGICPGQTTREDAEQILQSLPIGEENGIEKTELEKSITLLFNSQKFEGGKAIIEFDDLGHIVESVKVIPWKNELTMEQVVDLVGEPQEVIVTTHGSGGDSATEFATYDIWYPRFGLSVRAGIYNAGLHPAPNDIVLHSTLAVTSLEYSEKEKGKERLLDDLMTKLLPLQKPLNKNELEIFFYPWPGFGNSVPSFLDLERYRIGLDSDKDK